MKKLLLLLMLCISINTSYAQVDPTLAVGLETLTFNKGTIDVELLTQIIIEKQSELKKEALKRFIFNLFPEGNYTTKFYLQNSLHILLNEKNPEVIKRELMEIITNYALALGFTVAYQKIHSEYKDNISNLNHFSPIEDGVALFKETKKRRFNQFIKKEEKIEELTKLTEEYHIEKINNHVRFRSSLYYFINSIYNEDKKDNYNIFIQNEFKKFLIDFKSLEEVNQMVISAPLCTVDDDNSCFEEYFKIISSTNELKSFKLDKELIKDISLIINNPSKNKKETILKILRSKENIREYINTVSGIRRGKRISKRIVRKKERLSDKKFRKNLTKQDLDELKFKAEPVPFGLLLDVMASVLSENKDLREKGFFKQKINYQNNPQFSNLTPPQKEDLVKLRDSISSNISLYIENYDIIKYIASSFKEKDYIENVLNFVKEKYRNAFYNEALGSKLIESIAKYDNIKKLKERFTSYSEGLINIEDAKKEITVLVNSIEPLEVLIRKIEKKGSVNISNEDRKEIDEYFENFNETVASIYSIIKLESTTIADTSIVLEPIQPQQDKIEELKEILLQLKRLETDKNNEFKQLKNELDNIKTSKQDIQNAIIHTLLKDEKILEKVLSKINKELKSNIKMDGVIDTITKRKIGEFSKKVYLTLQNLNTKKNIRIKDIEHLQQELIPELIELNVISENSLEKIEKWINIVIPILQITTIDQIFEKKQIELNSRKVAQISELLKFISNLDNLDKAETFEHVMNLLREGNEELNKHIKDGEFKRVYNLFVNAVKKYTLVNTSAQYIEVDVASFLVELENYYEKNNNSNFGFYLGIGINQNFFVKEFSPSPNVEPINGVALASEKIGVKYRIHTFQRSSDYTHAIQDDIYLSKQSPFINEWYANLYGSGLLYSVANATTNQNFDHPHVGLGTGIRFFNALDFNVNIGIPFGDKIQPFRNMFIGFGFDVPLSEYLTRSRAKKAKNKVEK